MKKRVKHLIITAMAFLLCAVTVKAQSSEIFSGIDNTENYSTWTLAHMDRDISTFINLVALSGLEPSLLMVDNEHTALIPTNEAFNEMNLEDYLHLTDPKNKSELVEFVKFHFLPNEVMKYDFKDNQIIDKGGEDIAISVDEPFGTVYIGGARIVKDNIKTSNGVIHIVDRVITPTGQITAMK